MKLLFMFCNNCMEKIHTKHWLVDNRRCTCIFLEETEMKVTRRTYWANGLVTDRDMDCPADGKQEFILEQCRRVRNGPGINSVEVICASEGWVDRIVNKSR